MKNEVNSVCLTLNFSTQAFLSLALFLLPLSSNGSPFYQMVHILSSTADPHFAAIFFNLEKNFKWSSSMGFVPPLNKNSSVISVPFDSKIIHLVKQAQNLDFILNPMTSFDFYTKSVVRSWCFSLYCTVKL